MQVPFIQIFFFIIIFSPLSKQSKQVWGVFFGMRFKPEILRPLKQVFFYIYFCSNFSYWVRANKSSETEELYNTYIVSSLYGGKGKWIFL